MAESRWARDLTSTPEELAEYQEEKAVLQVAQRIWDLLEETGVSRSELAKRLGKSKAYVTQFLDGRTNMTVRTLSRICTALESDFGLTIGTLKRPGMGDGNPKRPAAAPKPGKIAFEPLEAYRSSETRVSDLQPDSKRITFTTQDRDQPVLDKVG